MFDEDLFKDSEWLNANRLTLNIDKIVYMSFSTRTIHESDTFIKLNNVNLSYSKTVEYMGVILVESLNFKQHIQMTSDKISKN